MKGQRRGKTDPMERQIEQALRPGEFVYDRACFSFVSELEQVATGIKELIAAEPERAVTICEVFLAGCHAKAEQLDDSSGNFGMFVKDLICLWIKARQADGADPDGTAGTLLRWMDDDPYAFCYEIEKDTSAAFDKAGRIAFEKQVRARFEAVSEDPSSWPYRRLSAVLRAIYVAQRNIKAYVAHAEHTGLTSEDCLTVAKLLTGRNPADALLWVERGRAYQCGVRVHRPRQIFDEIWLEKNRPMSDVQSEHSQGIEEKVLKYVGILFGLKDRHARSTPPI